MTSTERKRAWRLNNPERSRTAECRRAQARRNGVWDWGLVLGQEARPCDSSESYSRYEHSAAREKQRRLYARYGAGAHRLSRDELREVQAVMVQQAELAALEAEVEIE